MSAIASKITSLTIVYSTVYSHIKENIKAPRHWPLWGKFTGDRWIPIQRASNAENVSIWWRHHVLSICPFQWLVSTAPGTLPPTAPLRLTTTNLWAPSTCPVFHTKILDALADSEQTTTKFTKWCVSYDECISVVNRSNQRVLGFSLSLNYHTLGLCSLTDPTLAI